MARLDYSDPDEVHLRLDADENAVLSVVRHCRWWQRATYEGQVPGSTLVSAVTLTAERRMDQTIREIMLRSFHVVFPPEGGEATEADVKAAMAGRRRIR